MIYFAGGVISILRAQIPMVAFGTNHVGAQTTALGIANGPAYDQLGSTAARRSTYRNGGFGSSRALQRGQAAPGQLRSNSACLLSAHVGRSTRPRRRFNADVRPSVPGLQAQGDQPKRNYHSRMSIPVSGSPLTSHASRPPRYQ